MKIDKVKCTSVRIPLKEPKSFALRTVAQREYTVVEITADEATTGWGYTWGPGVIGTIIDDLLKDSLLGEDPRRIEYLWEKMYRNTMVWGRRGLLLRAISAVDIALWDLMGKITRQPLYQLLGGYRTRIPAYYSGGYYLSDFEKPDDYLQYMQDEIDRLLDLGFTSYKIKVGAAPLKIDLQRAALARERLGDGKLMIDANCGYGPDEAIKLANEFAKYEPEWLEEPFSPDDVASYRKLTEESPIPIAVGENNFTRWEFNSFLRQRAADVLQGDPIIMGGITEFRRLVGMVSPGLARLAPHNSHNINVHVGTGLPHIDILEYFDLQADVFNFDVFIQNPVQPEDGYLNPPDDPGHGLQLDRQALNRYRV